MKRFSPLRPRRAGLTLLELLVALGILSLLVAISIPAVQQVRASSRATTCRNNLRQMGLALASVAEETGAFPTSNRPLVRLLPKLDQAEAAAIIRGEAEFLEEVGFQAHILACPADGRTAVHWGQGNYQINIGTRFRAEDGVNGFMTKKKDLSPSHITDGLSNTVAFSERLVAPLHWESPIDELDPAHAARFPVYSTVQNKDAESAAVENCLTHPTTRFPSFVPSGGSFVMSGYLHLLPPNHSGCYNGPEDTVDTEYMLLTPTSHHDGGVNALFADGHVTFVSETIDIDVWQAAGTRAGGEKISLP